MKQQDIRNLFNDDDDSFKKLPKSHRTEFLEKLKASKTASTKRFNYNIIFKTAAMLAIFFVIGFVVFNQFSKESNYVVEESAIELQIKDIEQQYLASIEIEWQSFLSITKDEYLIKRFEKRLNDLDTDYQEISNYFKNDTNNISIIEDLIENLKTRLKLLKDIQEHIKLLNQEIEHYENII